MKIACVDKTANDRMLLQRFIEDAHEQCRSSVGHTSLASPYPASREEILLAVRPEAVVVGSGFSLEESFLTAKEIREKFPELALFVILSPDNLSLRSLRRFEGIQAEVFTKEDAAIRFIHRLSSFGSSRPRKLGQLVVARGAKGGIGMTSVVSGLAHAAQSLNLRAIVVDLSDTAAFPLYMGATRLHSPEFASLLTDQLSASPELVERMIEVAPNGVNMLLAPSGGHEMREMWLRDRKRFESTLEVIDLLREQYDLILVDNARSEGILDFALTTRADVRLAMTSNDASSIHLLHHVLENLRDLPGVSNTRLLINLTIPRGLLPSDVLSFVGDVSAFGDLFTSLPAIPFDPRARDWIGTGNSFFTEANRRTQQLFELIVAQLCPVRETAAVSHLIPTPPYPAKNLLERARQMFRRVEPTKESLKPRLALPPATTRQAAPLFGAPQMISVSDMEGS